MPQQPWEEQYDKSALMQRGTPAAGEPGIGQTVYETGRDVLGGIGSGVFKTARGAAQLAGVNSPYLDRLATPPDSFAGRTGQMIEQGAEYLIPGGLVERGAAGLLAGAPAVARIAGRAGLEGLAAGTVAGVQSGGDPAAARNAALLGAGVSAAGSAATAAAPWLARTLQEGAETQYGRALNPTKERFKSYAEDVIPELLERRQWIGSLPRTLETTRERLRHFGQQIDDAWQQMGQQGVTAQVDPILNRLNDVARENYLVQNAHGQLVPVEGAIAGGMRELGAIQETIRNAATPNPVTGAMEIPVATLRRLRQIWDEVADKSGAFHKNPRDLHSWTTGMVNRYAGDSVRAELAQARPDLAALNQEYGFLRRLGDTVESTMERRVGQQKPLTRRLMQGTGAVVGSTLGSQTGGLTGGAMGAVVGPIVMEGLQTLVSSNAWRTIDAVTRSRIADAIARGNRGAAEFYLRKALIGAGGATITKQE
jgi:hypothetical protein